MAQRDALSLNEQLANKCWPFSMLAFANCLKSCEFRASDFAMTQVTPEVMLPKICSSCYSSIFFLSLFDFSRNQRATCSSFENHGLC